MPSEKFYLKSIEDTLKDMNSGTEGISREEAKNRLAEYGKNSLSEERPDRWIEIFLRQFKSPLIYILLVASLVVFAMGDIVDGFVILLVLFINSIVGTVQEGKAQNTLLALKKISETDAFVIRGGIELVVPDHEIVPGDLIALKEGGKVPADARIVYSSNLRANESILTGESDLSEKTDSTITKETALPADQKNMLFKGTYIVGGEGRAIVIATGVNTIIGEISKEISSVQKEIPLQNDIRKMSKLIIIAIAVVCTTLFFSGLALGKPTQEMFTTVVSMTVSLIPEGLPVVVTLILAAGVWRMSKKNALVKKLQAVEALGQTKILAVDKTGTITKNELVIRKIFTDGKIFEISGTGFEPVGKASLAGAMIDPLLFPALLFAGRVGAMCANARAAFSEELGGWRVSGDPTEACMRVFAEKIGILKEELEIKQPLLAEIPFDYKNKYHATVHKEGRKQFLKVVGSPEVVFKLCSKIIENGKEIPFTKEKEKEIENIMVIMASEGLRTVAFATSFKPPQVLSPENISGLIFGGIFGMKDSIRPEAFDAVKRAEAAGIKVVMITGDHKETAKAIACEAGIYHDGDEVLTGKEIENMTEFELADKIAKVTVFARVSPEHKMEIINAYKKRGEIIAMTGDGVNDAPSLAAADLGVSMGKIGTEVAKEASDIVLLDDNLGSIVDAVDEGRNIFKSIKRVILYLFSTSMAEIFAISLSLFLGLPLLLVPAQIIWLNFVTDGFLVVALGMEPKEKGNLDGKLKNYQKQLVDKYLFFRVLAMSIPMAIGTFLIFITYSENPAKANTMALVSLAVFQWLNAWNCRSGKESIFSSSITANKYLLSVMPIMLIIQLLAVYSPIMNKILRTVPIDLSDWLLVIIVASSVIWIEEIRKYFYRKKKYHKHATV